MSNTFDEEAWQILKLNGNGETVLHSWHTTRGLAEEELERAEEELAFIDVWIEQGTEFISKRCEGCGTIHCFHRYDVYGHRRGWWCDECYQNDAVFTYPKEVSQASSFDSLREAEE